MFDRALQVGYAIASGFNGRARLNARGALESENGQIVAPPLSFKESLIRVKLLANVLECDTEEFEKLAWDLLEHGDIEIDAASFARKPPSLTEPVDDDFGRWRRKAVRTMAHFLDSSSQNVEQLCHCIANRTERELAAIDFIPGLPPISIGRAWVDVTLRPMRHSRDHPGLGVPEPFGRTESPGYFLERIIRSGLVFADPGAGKSTLVRWIAGRIIAGAQRGFDLPLVVRLRDYARFLSRGEQVDLLEFAVRDITGFTGDAIADAVHRIQRFTHFYPDMGGAIGPTGLRPLLILDGLDEVGDHASDIVAAIARAMDRIPVLVPARPMPIPPNLSFESIARIEPFSFSAMRRLTDNLLTPGLAATLRRHLDMHPDLRELARNPFVLSALCGLTAHRPDGDPLPVGLRGLYEGVLRAIETEHRIKHTDAAISFRDARKTIERLALHLLTDASSAPRLQFTPSDVEFAGDRRRLMDETIAPSRVAKRSDSDQPSYEFLHPTLHEHLAITELLDRDQSELDSLLQKYALHPFWRASWTRFAIYAREAGDAESLRRLFKALRWISSNRDRFGVIDCFAAELLGAAGAENGGVEAIGEDLRPRLLELATTLDDPRYPLQSLRFLDPVYATTELARKHSHVEAGRSFNDAIDNLDDAHSKNSASLESVESSKSAIAALKDANDEVWTDAVRSLARCTEPETTDALRRAYFACTTPDNRRAVIDALMRQATDSARDALLSILALAPTDDETMPELLNQFQYIPCGSAAALLLSIANDTKTKETTRAAAVRALSKCSFATVIQDIAMLLAHPESPEIVLDACGAVLRDRAGPDESSTVEKIAISESGERANAAFKAIVGVADRHPHLAQFEGMKENAWKAALRFSESEHPLLKTLAIGRLMPLIRPESESTLVELCSSQNENAVRAAAAEAIGRMGDPAPKFIDAIEHVLQDGIRLGKRRKNRDRGEKALVEKATAALLKLDPDRVLPFLGDPDAARVAAAWAHETGTLFFDDHVTDSLVEPEVEASPEIALRAIGEKIKEETIEELRERVESHERMRREIFGKSRSIPTSKKELKAEAVVLTFLSRNWDEYRGLRDEFKVHGRRTDDARRFISGKKIVKLVLGFSGRQNIVNQYAIHKAARQKIGAPEPGVRKAKYVIAEQNEKRAQMEAVSGHFDALLSGGEIDVAMHSNAIAWLNRNGAELSLENADELMEGIKRLADALKSGEISDQVHEGLTRWWRERSDPKLHDLELMIQKLP